jgi:hypothetical protein
LIRALLGKLSQPAAPRPMVDDVAPSAGGAAAGTLLEQVGMPPNDAVSGAAIAPLLSEVRSGRPGAPHHPDAVACDAAELVAALSCRDLETDAARARAARASLIQGVSNLAGEDGCPLAPPFFVARAAWAAALAIRWSEDAGQALDPSVQRTLVGVAHALTRIGGTLGWLPGARADVQGFAETPSTAPCIALSIEPSQLDIVQDWRAWSWRASEAAVAHGHIKDQPTRVWVTAHTGTFQWDIGDHTELSATVGAPCTLVRARVDTPSFIAELAAPDWTRIITARKARIVVRDTLSAPTSVAWSIQPRWKLEPNKDGFIGTDTDAELIIKLDPEWRWSIDGHSIVGNGSTERIRCSFEIR